MAKTAYKSVDDYIAAQPEENQTVLSRVRAIIARALPDAEEAISYQVPAYKRNGRTVIFFAGWKAHYSLYPASEHVVGALGKELAAYKVSKGTIRFPLSEPVPTKLIERIAKLRSEELSQAASAKADSPKRTVKRRTAPAKRSTTLVRQPKTKAR